MGKFIIRTHGRLHEWVAEEKGLFKDEGLDYEFTTVHSEYWSTGQTSVEAPEECVALLRAPSQNPSNNKNKDLIFQKCYFD